MSLPRIVQLASALCLLPPFIPPILAREAKPMPDPPQIAATRDAHPDLAPFDQLMISFMTENRVPGGALAVTRNRRLVYARGFGHADVERREPVQPTSLFRIASLSKPLTAVAILQLIEQGRLRLDDKVFDLLEFQPHLAEGASIDPRLRQITIGHLLHHTGGWDRDKSFDPMFRSVEIARALGVPSPARQEHIIRYMMGRPLDFTPGDHYAYSNFGYSLLGRVIEAVAHQPYESYVRAQVLTPLGITDMRIGATLLTGRAPTEVKYYHPEDKKAPAVLGDKVGEPVPCPYGAWYLEAFDSHGGWIASAIDMVRVATEFDDPPSIVPRSARPTVLPSPRLGKPGVPLLSPESIAAMFARPDGSAGYNPDGTPRDAYYGCGWNVRPVGAKANHWHMGMINGTAALLVRRHDGINWCVLLNTHADTKGESLGKLMDPLVHRAADAVKQWPSIDLFERFHLMLPGR